MSRRGSAAALAVLLVTAAMFTPAANAADPAPAWSIQSLAEPTNFLPGRDSGLDHYELFITNNGGQETDGSAITITDVLPAGLEVKAVDLFSSVAPAVNLNGSSTACKTETAGDIRTVTCTLEGAPATLLPTEQVRVAILLKVPQCPGLAESCPLVNQAQVKGGGAAEPPVSATSHNEISSNHASAGFQDFRATLTAADGSAVTQAAAHPYQYTTTFALNTEAVDPDLVPPTAFPLRPAGGNVKQIEVALPPGLVGNPTAVPPCSAQQFNTTFGGPGNTTLNECPDVSAVGLINVRQLEGGGVLSTVPLYNLIPPKGMPAQLGFQILGLPFYINTRLRSNGDYGITAYLDNTTEAQRVTAAQVTVWGVPGAESHDRLRGSCLLVGGLCHLGSQRPFLRLPTSCASALMTTMSFDTWSVPGAFQREGFTEPPPSNCADIDFSPSVEGKPTTSVADSPSGLHFNLHIPQVESDQPEEDPGEADLRETTVTLPEGLIVNPASADGLAGCTEQEIGFEGLREGRNSFSSAPPQCPNASKIGTVEVDTPLVDHPLPGAVYLAQPRENPFDSLLAIYITVHDPQTGVVVKLPARVESDSRTGRLTTTVEASPQTPFEDFKLDFFAGARASLRTPALCGTKTVTTSLTPYSAPQSGPPATPSDSFSIESAPTGGTCPTTPAAQPHAPSFEAGTANPFASAYSPFVLRLTREDGSQEIKGLNVALPPGLSGKLAGVAQCADASLAAAMQRPGRLEQASPSCPVGSRVGTVSVGAGAGPSPYYVQGAAYLAGPYKGAPLSLAIVTPAVAGPFDLGTVVVRTALQVDPESARISAVSDPIPTILEGIPLDVRSIALRLDRDRFTLNPTSCEAMSVGGDAISVLGQVAPLRNRFQVGGCRSLGFNPKLSLRLKGGTKRNDNPALRATVTYPKGAYANIAFAQVALPHSEFLDQSHIRTICTRVQFAAKRCPRGAIYGRARAITPLLDAPLEGPVYLRSSNNPLPDLVADLNGQIHIVLSGRTDSFRAGLRNTFEAVPDQPVTKFFLELRGGKRGLLVNSTDICKRTHRANVRFVAHNGKVRKSRPVLKADCKKQPRPNKRKGR